MRKRPAADADPQSCSSDGSDGSSQCRSDEGDGDGDASAAASDDSGDADSAGWAGSGAAAAKRPRLSSSTAAACDAASMPPPPPRRRPPRPPGAPSGAAAVHALLHDGNAAARPAPDALAAGAVAASAPVQWKGRLMHRRGASVAELARLSVQLPAAYADQFPPALFAAELAPRAAVPLGRHAVCRTALLPASASPAAPPAAAGRQAAALSAMAAAGLVARVPLQLCELIVVPYLDSAGATRAVSFLRL